MVEVLRGNYDRVLLYFSFGLLLVCLNYGSSKELSRDMVFFAGFVAGISFSYIVCSRKNKKISVLKKEL
jgi:hypothetical protein